MFTQYVDGNICFVILTVFNIKNMSLDWFPADPAPTPDYWQLFEAFIQIKGEGRVQVFLLINMIKEINQFTQHKLPEHLYFMVALTLQIVFIILCTSHLLPGKRKHSVQEGKGEGNKVKKKKKHKKKRLKRKKYNMDFKDRNLTST